MRKRIIIIAAIVALVGAGWSWGGDAPPPSPDSGSTIIAGN